MTRHPDRPRGARLLAGLILGTLAVGLGPVACSGDDPPRVQEIVVPLGTADKLQRGEVVAVMPAEMHFQVGDTLRIRNEDRAGQAVGPYQVAAHDEFEITFGSPGRFEGACSLSAGERYEIVVTE